ncbi:amino acid adenylation domain-containing protein [Microcoleus sp. CAWBG51]|uniref:amino acid adenylation domain-containing protein n=1 Tax=Microcoleus sp. CAWBG51 TaxID=2841648 RepID=UPI0025F017DE|nr:amino acid adenylation domain-containing protein [Microcoleus sp. CAWBG51]
MPYLLHQLLETSAKRYPDREAVIYKNNAITYHQLNTLSNQLAWVLRDSGIEKGDRVGICLKKSIEEIVAIYGILKVGATYVPIEPSDPVQRIAFFLENCGIKALVTTEKTIANLYKEFPQSQHLQYAILTDEKATEAKEKFTQIKIVTWQDVLQSHSHPLPPPDLIDCDLANITYTSGSTGQPKGVMVTHRSILNFASCFYHCLEIQPGERISHQLPSYFAASVVNIFTSIQAGATIVIVPPELPIFPIELANFIEDQRINIWFSVPSLLTQLILRGNLQQHQFPDLRKILFAGEVFPVQYLRQLMEMIPHLEYCNIYGSAETGARTYYIFKDISPDMTSVPIGKACANTELIVVNEQNEIASPGEVGELYARGSSLMKGYWGDREKTKEVLVPFTVHPHLGEEIVFRTGDLVKQDAEGNYIYIGRRDHTIKSRGYRIELGEIEKVIQNHPEVAEVVVIPIPDEEIGNRLKAVVVAKVGSRLKPSDLQYFCTQYIPKYMIPESVEFRSELPKTSTGKVDRVLLGQSELTGKGNA